MKRALVLLAVLGLTSGCSHTPKAIMRHDANKVAATVVVYTGSIDVTITTADGEAFSGKTTSISGEAIGYLEDPKATSPLGGVAYYSNLTPSTTASAIAGNQVVSFSEVSAGVLTGDHGHTMWCNFKLIPFGGTGICDISDGRIIDLDW